MTMPKSTTMQQITPVILCGGSGTRLWPLSRAGFPKQFLVLSGNNSLFQQAIERVNGLACVDISVGETLVVTNEEHRFLALDQLRELKHITATLLLEPVGRNTAPALTLAALQATATGQDPILVVTPADHTVTDGPAFTAALQRSVRAAASGDIVILGITPTGPETGFGYIQRTGAAGPNGEYSVAQFAEKPDLQTAIGYLACGDYAWNSGMFVLKASTWIKALAQFRPDIAKATDAAWAGKTSDAPFVRPDAATFAGIPSESVDYAVIERCPGTQFDIHMVPLAAGWNDLGAWDAVWQVGQQDANGNVTSGDTLLADTSNSLIHASSRMVPFAVGYAIGKCFDALAAITGKKFAISSIRVKKFCANSVFETSIAKTGFVPRVSLSEALERTVRYEFIESHEGNGVFYTE